MNGKNRFARPTASQSALDLDTHNWSDGTPGPDISMKELLNAPTPTRPHILPGLIVYGETTYVHVAHTLNGDTFALLIAYVSAYGIEFAPYGIGAGVDVLCLLGKSHPVSYRKVVQRIAERDTKHRYEADNGEKLKFRYRFHENEVPLNLCSRADQDTFLKSVPKNVKLIVFTDLGAWTDPKTDLFDASEVATLMTKLNERGIAILLLSRSTRKPSQLDFSGYRNPPNLVWLTQDAAAPTEYGGGFLVSRNKMDEEDPVPTKYRFWYSVKNGKLDSGHFVNDVTPSEAKRTVMQERQLKVEELLAQGMPQKDISMILRVDPATISRDVAALKAIRKPESKPE